MCLGVPGRILEVYEEQGLRMGKVEFDGIRKQVCLEHTPEAKIGDFVVVHVGFSLSVIDPHEAERTFQFLDRMGELGEIHNSAPYREFES